MQIENGLNNQTSVVWTLPSNATLAVLNVSDAAVSLVFELGWGRICEVRGDGSTVKCVDPVRDGWSRTTFANASYLSTLYQSNNSQFFGLGPPFSAELSTFIFLNDTSPLAKFSLAVEGWPFARPSNRLRADFFAAADFTAQVKCGQAENYEVTVGADELSYRFYTRNRTAMSLGLLRYCFADSQRRSVDIDEPVFSTDGVVTLSLYFSSFESSLDYDPNFALLLGFSAPSSCGALLSWVLPASFLAGAAVFVALFIALSYITPVQRLIFGSEGFRVKTLRQFIKDNNIDSEIQLE